MKSSRGGIGVSKPNRDGTNTYTYQDYLTWEGPERWELIDGMPYLMTSPLPSHQQILLALASAFHAFFQNRPCTPYIAPLDLTFEASEDTKKVVQPDLFVMCGEYGREKRIVGVPTLIVEILSPSTAKHDLIRKLNLYQKVGVKEYWIVDPEEQTINVYLHDGMGFRLMESEYKAGDRLCATVFPELEIEVREVFE